MSGHPLERQSGRQGTRDDATVQRDEATAAELQSVVAAAIARARGGSGERPTGLRAHLPFRRKPALVPVPMDLPRVGDSLRVPHWQHGTYLAIWCHRLERVGDRLLAYGIDDDGRPVRWIDEPRRLGWLETELAERDEPIPVTIGHWQRV